jgi:poly-gamma-glutamate capsule biosynthesis protein CapA/YwtB (metallophosphatase superfamily)
MLKRSIGFVLAVLLLAGCAAPKQTKKPVVVAVAPSVADPPGLANVTYIRVDEPLKALEDGRAELALVGGEGEQVLMQGWLDPPLALTRAEAEERLSSAGPPDTAGPKPGAVARGRLADLKPGWRAVPVDGVTPTPETVRNGQYPLAGRLSAVAGKNLTAEGLVLLEAVQQLTAAAPGPPDSWVRLAVTGDFMLSRGVARAMQEHGTLYPVEKVKDYLAAADIAFANLESPIGVKGRPLPNKQIWFRAAPEAVEILKAAGVDGVTVANNHIMDYDEENFLETLERLDAAGIRHVGGGKNIAEARRPLVLEAKGLKIAFLGYSQFADLFFDWGYPRSFAATETRPGVPHVQDDWLAADIQAARAVADVVAVTFHWGDEFQNYPNVEQQRLARLCIDQGADLVLGYHPHAIQGFELYKGGFIAYSTGNFIMDRQDTDLARESMILDFQVSKAGVRSVSVQPIWIRDEQPYIMTGAEGERLLQKMRTISGWR